MHNKSQDDTQSTRREKLKWSTFLNKELYDQLTYLIWEWFDLLPVIQNYDKKRLKIPKR
jgi:predicted carbohydrate-binding protein with CBM5 and CBM33 domain